jgi:ATP-grasp domain
VAFGAGGALAELVGEASFWLAPLTDLDAGELVCGGKAGRLVAGFRGAPLPTRLRWPTRCCVSDGSPPTSPSWPNSI